jgi:predicted MPP superfamily phosphohydrolase
VEKLKPDLIVLTGDCLDSDAADTAPTVEFCAALANVAPTFYVYGNNEVERIYGMALTQKALDEKFDVKDDDSRDLGAEDQRKSRNGNRQTRAREPCSRAC